MGLGAESPVDAHLFDVLAGAPVSHTPAEALAAAAARHGVSGLVADALAAAGLPVPDSLAQDARAQIARGLKTKRFTLQVLDALTLEGVTPVLLKGYGLAVRLYSEQPLARPSSDVDVLVRKDELPRVSAALGQLGLRRHDDAGLADVFEEHHHLSFAGASGLVEAHFRLINTLGRGGFDDAALRSRTRSWTLDGRAVRLLDEEDEFLYLATHAAQHAFLRVSWLVDLQRYLARATHFDWARMAARSREAGFHTAVATALELVERLLRVQLPFEARAHFRLRGLRRAVDRRLFSSRQVESAAVADHRLGSFLLRLWLVDSPAHGVRHLFDGARRLLRRVRAEG
jgi:hypothetical protein